MENHMKEKNVEDQLNNFAATLTDGNVSTDEDTSAYEAIVKDVDAAIRCRLKASSRLGNVGYQ